MWSRFESCACRPARAFAPPLPPPSASCQGVALGPFLEESQLRRSKRGLQLRSPTIRRSSKVVVFVSPFASTMPQRRGSVRRKIRVHLHLYRVVLLPVLRLPRARDVV